MAFLDGPTPYAFAHRGYATDGDENSLAAFARAVELGYTYLETDVRVTADGVALAFHDASLDRLTDLRGPVHTQPWSTVRRARIAGREPIPLLADVLTAWPHTRINLDVKSSRGVAATIDVLRRTRTVDRVCVAAFATRRIAAVRRAFGSELCTAFGPGAVAALRLAGRAPLRGATCLEVPVRIGRRRIVDRRFLRTAMRLDLPVIAYTVNDPAEMRELLDLGVAGLMTDRAAVLRDVLRERGQWP